MSIYVGAAGHLKEELAIAKDALMRLTDAIQRFSITGQLQEQYVLDQIQSIDVATTNLRDFVMTSASDRWRHEADLKACDAIPSI